MSNKMINSFKQILEDNQESISYNDFSIKEDKKIIGLFADSLKYLGTSLNNSYKIPKIKILFKDTNNGYNDFIFKDDFDNCDKKLNLEYTIELSKSAKIIFTLLCTNEEHLENIKQKEEALITTFDIISQTLYNKYLEECIKELSLTDQTTGLYNRKYLEIYLDKILSLSKRENKKVAFLKIGIDHFKAVIDEFDYNIGDKVLIALADILRDNVRTSDIIVRVVGDEFLVVLQNVGTSENATMISQKIIDSFAKTKIIINKETEQTLTKSICIGISIFPKNAQDIDDILRTSDNALYEARNIGRSKYFLYQEDNMNTIDLF